MKPGERLDKLIDQLREAELLVLERETALKEAQALVNDLLYVTMPAVMEDVGLEELRTPSGRKVVLQDDPKVDCPKSRMAQFISWLDKHGHGGIVTRQLIVDFGKDSQEDAQTLLKRAEELGRDAKMAGNVHHSRLSAWAKRRLQNGDKIPVEILNVFDRKRVRIK